MFKYSYWAPSFKLLMEMSSFLCVCRMIHEIVAWCMVTHTPEVLNSPTYIEISVLGISIINIFSDQAISE